MCIAALAPLAGLLLGACVAAEERCPADATVAGAAPPAGLEEWCERRDAAGSAVKHGRYVAWFDDGQKQAEIEFVDGREHGHATAWYPNGRKAAEGEYVDGARSGLWTRWYENGRKQAETSFAAGTKHGLERRYDESGALQIEVQWENGDVKQATDGKASSTRLPAGELNGA